MRRTNLLASLFTIGALVLFVPREASAQNTNSPAAGPREGQVIQELLGEVRLLRVALQRMSVNAYRGQVLVERLRLQQESVNRLTQELASIKSELGDMKAAQANAKARADDAEKQQDKGLLSESAAAVTKSMLEGFKQREQSLIERETQLSAQLDAERTNLTDLNKRLDALELEIVTTANQNAEPKERVKR